MQKINDALAKMTPRQGRIAVATVFVVLVMLSHDFQTEVASWFSDAPTSQVAENQQ